MGTSRNALINLEMLRTLKKGKKHRSREETDDSSGGETVSSASSKAASRQEVHQGGGGCFGCEWSDPVHLSRIQQKAQLGEAKDPRAYSLRTERTASDVDERKDGESSIDDGPALESSPLGFAGSRFLAGSKFDASPCGPP